MMKAPHLGRLKPSHLGVLDFGDQPVDPFGFKLSLSFPEDALDVVLEERGGRGQIFREVQHCAKKIADGYIETPLRNPLRQ